MKNKFYITSIIVAFVLGISHLHAQTPCSVPTGLTATNVTSSTASLAWNAVSNNAFYNVRYRVSNSTTWQMVTTQTANLNLTGLLSLTVYEWQVQAACPGSAGAIILSAFSPSAFFTTTGTSACNVPTGLFVNNLTPTSVTLHWNSTGASSYKVRYRQTGTTAWTVKNATTNLKNLTGLVPATAYDWQVRSKCVSGGTVTFSAWSPTSNFQTPGSTTCATPTGLTAAGGGSNSIALAWNATGATSYNIRYRPSNVATWTTTTSATNSKTLTGLAGGMAYIWEVQGVCMSGGTVTLSAWSADAFFTIASPISLMPNPATDKVIVTYESSSAQQVSLTIRDFLGTAYDAITKSADAGANQYELNVSNLKNGMYYIELAGAEGKQALKFYVQH